MHRGQIDSGAFDELPLSQLPGFDAHMGLQLEYLLLQNRSQLLKAIGVAVADVSCDGPYRQSQTENTKGCQIDYLAQTRTNNLFICELKFKCRELGTEVIQAMQEKVSALKIPRGYAPVPILFHIGGVAPTVETAGYFYRIIDIADFLEM